MTEDHIFAVAQLEKICFDDPWSEKSIASELRNPLSLWLVAIQADAVVGYIGSQVVMDEADMMNLAVHPDWRKQGVGQLLVQSLVDELKGREVTSLSLEVRTSNEPAKRLYLRNGFEEVGRRRNYYRNPKEDALILRKEWLL